jgi:hypothetical protein
MPVVVVAAVEAVVAAEAAVADFPAKVQRAGAGFRLVDRRKVVRET